MPGRSALVVAFVAGLAFAVSLAAPAHASERGKAERLYTKGLAELHAGRTDTAIALFQQAVADDPNDIRALYYRGLGYGHAGRYDEAVVDLRRVVAAADPGIERDHLELGYALYRAGKLDEAVAELQIAAKKPGKSAAEAELELGIVESRRGHYEAARTALTSAATRNPEKAVAARYYQGLAALRAGNTDQATEDFTWVRDNGGDSEFARQASNFLANLAGGPTGKRYLLHAGLAFEYDSNVALAPDDNKVAKNVYDISDESDGRAVITAGGRYAVISRPNFQLALGYDFLQSLHFDLERFDVQSHKLGGEGQWVHGPLSIGAAAGYEHAMLDEHNLLDGGTVLPWVRYAEGTFGKTEAYYRMRARDFNEEPYDPIRDSINHAAGLRQYFALGALDRNVIVGYRFDTDVADKNSGKEFNYDGNQVEAGIDWAFNNWLVAGALYAYKFENYTASAADGREDNEHTVVTRVEARVFPRTYLIGSYVFRRNDSNQTSFDYTRHITSLGVEVRY
ncbi:MAG TPA: tetratricopeptide repeat protein [Candidatus Limnocylindrales bacterium]|nr:tetratricopeptide repeat protein [Candidatus Limnocylindrales bacterium]